MVGKKKILYVITKSNFGGAQRQVFDLATGLSKEKFEVAVALGGKGLLKEKLDAAGIAAEVTGRPKYIHSIINKMKRKRVEFGELYDVRAVRVLVSSIQNCYAALSVTHELWSPIANEFDDYIVNPKGNGYRSLHTTLRGRDGYTVELQVRTRQMHAAAEWGPAAHHRYKRQRLRSEGQPARGAEREPAVVLAGSFQPMLSAG